MEIVQYILISITTILGLGFGVLVSYLTPDEQKSAQKYFRKIILPFAQEKVFATLGILFALSSLSRYFFLATVIIFLYSIPVASFLFSNKKNKELVKAARTFILAAVAVRLFLWE